MRERNLRFFWIVALSLATTLNAMANALGASPSPKTIYEIFTRSFQDSNSDGIGDLDGITSRLDYLTQLGIDAIWLTPIYPSPSYHGYDITDYEQVKADYGDLNAFQRLLEESHRRGIRVLLDIAVNHTSIEHPWFDDPSLYLWSQIAPDWPNAEGKWYPSAGQYYYSSFDESMPDLNWRNDDVLARIEKVFEFWTRMGVDGFRLDAAKYLVKGPQGQENQPETHEIWKKLVRDARGVARNGLFFVGEIWDSAQNIAGYYGQGDELDAAFDFPVMGALRSALVSRNGHAFAQALEERIRVQPTSTFTAPFVGSHDLSRLASELGGDFSRMKLAAAAFLTLPGSAVVYYGDEIGMPDGESTNSPRDGADLGKRTPMQWDDSENRGFSSARPWNPISTSDQKISVHAQQQDPNSLWRAYQSLIELRNRYPEISTGEVSEVREPAPGIVSFVRSLRGVTERVMVVLNFTAGNISGLSVPFQSASSVSCIYGGASAAVGPSGSILISLPDSSAAVFLIP